MMKDLLPIITASPPVTHLVTLYYWDPHSVDKEQTNLLHSRNRTCIQSQTKNSSYDSECRIIMQIVVLYLENRTQVISL